MSPLTMPQPLQLPPSRTAHDRIWRVKVFYKPTILSDRVAKHGSVEEWQVSWCLPDRVKALWHKALAFDTMQTPTPPRDTVTIDYRRRAIAYRTAEAAATLGLTAELTELVLAQQTKTLRFEPNP